MVSRLELEVGMDQNRIGLRHSLKLLSFLLISIILPTELAAERCPNCLDGECQRSGECTKGCIDGFADTYCRYKCQSTCKDAKCQLDKNTGRMVCLSGCEDGYCGKQCKAPCVDGCLDCDQNTCTCPLGNELFYGDNCQHSCLDRRLVCDNKGQYMSCIDGFHGRNCEEICGSKCIRCKQETGKCIKCQQGFRGDSCDQVSTEKTFESKTPMTERIQPVILTDLAAERCPNCLDGECQRSGECTKGCIDGFADKYCQHKCQSTCKDAKCLLDKKTGMIICLYGCEDGYCGQQCKAPCVNGCLDCDYRTCTCPRCNGSFYGDKCQHSCLDGCLACDNKGKCLSCRKGLHGSNCEHKCSIKCIRCKQDTGKCIKCLQGFHGDSCDQVSTEKTTEVKHYASDVIAQIVLIFVQIVVLSFVAKYVNGLWTEPVSIMQHDERAETTELVFDSTHLKMQLFGDVNNNSGTPPGADGSLSDVPPDSETSQGAAESLLGDVNPTSQAQRKDCEKEDTVVWCHMT